MNEEGTKYKISLEDYFSKGLKSAEANAHSFERSIDSVGHHLSNFRNQLLTGLGIGFGLHEIYSFGKESVKAFEEAQHAKTQLDNALDNRNIGFNLDELIRQQEEYAKKWIFSKDQIAKAQLALTDFKYVQGQTFKNLEELAIDIASKKNLDLTSVITDLGRAINDPEKAGRLLRTYGVNFTDTQEKLMRSLLDTGQAAKAQQLIMDELSATFKGSADAAAQTAEGQKRIAANSWEDMKETFGEAISTIQVGLIPTFNTVTEKFQKFADWTVEHQDDIGYFFEKIIAGAEGLLKYLDKVRTLYNIPEIVLSGFKGPEEKMMYDEKGVLHPESYFKKPLSAFEKKTQHDLDVENAEWDRLARMAKNKDLGYGPKSQRLDMGSVDLGSGLSEPKASKIQNITINLNNPFQNMKITPATMEMGTEELKTQLTETLIAAGQDAAIVVTE